MLLSGSQMIFNTYIVLFAYEFLEIGLISAGLLLVIAEVGGSFGRIIWGLVSDRLFDSKRIVIILIISIMVAGMGLLFAFLPAGISFWAMTPLTFVFGFCVSGFNGIWMNAATELVPFRQSGIATGFSLTIGAVGVMFAPPVFGHLVDTTGAYTWGWLFVAMMMGVVMTLLLGAMRFVKGRG
ncbi:MFS transporter [Lentibacillus sp. JNUCC-1]|uniref:MFS transporter n=1 Tax=Lentibacillus sp. JNUCC-1 TaxID=2654513 RepID=UPI001E394367|nr:MFS transporter [Lentibacillus sp. JNUCC-1]